MMIDTLISRESAMRTLSSNIRLYTNKAMLANIELSDTYFENSKVKTNTAKRLEESKTRKRQWLLQQLSHL